MVFRPMSWVPKLPQVPDTTSIPDFLFDEKYGRAPLSTSKDLFTCGLSGRSISAEQQKTRIEVVAQGLAEELGWKVNAGTPYDKVAGIFALNTIDVLTIGWAVHRLNGIASPANAAYSADELRHQLANSGASCVFTILPLLETAKVGAAKAGIPRDKIYIIPLPGQNNDSDGNGFKTLEQIEQRGRHAPALEPLRWTPGQGAQQTAYLCYSSGTSGLPKGVMISHSNVIANVLQISMYDAVGRAKYGPDYRDVCLGLLPFSHIYGLVVVCMVAAYSGDQVIVLPKFEMQHFLEAIQNYKINTLYIVPPIIISMVNNEKTLKRYNLNSVGEIFTGAAPLGVETATELNKQWPAWKVRQGYGLTETCTVVCSTLSSDVVFGSSGCLVPGIDVKVVNADGREITGYDQPGELLVKSPSVVLGYLKNDKATQETFVEHAEGRFMRTGDEVVIRKSPQGNEHIWIVDRIKELIKVKGLQVAPAELESALLEHPAVADCAVIPVPDDRAGEVPKAYVVKSNSVAIEDSNAALKRSIRKSIEKHKARHKWLDGGVEFVDVIPKSPSGKILRRLLRDKDKEARLKRTKKAGAKL